MRKMKNYVVMLCAMLAMGAFTASCSSDEEAVQGVAGEGQASVMIDLSTDLAYSRAINESEYKNTDNYKVSLFKGEESVFKDVLYNNLEVEYKVEPSVSYTLTACYGEDVVAGYDKLFVKGSTQFSVSQGDRKSVSVKCTPANAKFMVVYEGLNEDDTFEDYFQDCEVSIKTSYMNEVFQMNKDDVGKELYLKTGDTSVEAELSFTVTDKEKGEPVTIEGFENERTITLKPAVAYTLTIKPSGTDIEGGLLGLDITVDNSVDDEDVDITIPGEYLPTGTTE